jgi:hypothetical protein
MDRPSQRFRPRTGACKPGSARCIKSGGTHRSLKSPTCTSCVFISARAAGIRSSGIVFVADEALSAPLPLIEYMPPPLGHNHVSCAGWGSFCTLFSLHARARPSRALHVLCRALCLNVLPLAAETAPRGAPNAATCGGVPAASLAASPPPISLLREVSPQDHEHMLSESSSTLEALLQSMRAAV